MTLNYDKMIEVMADAAFRRVCYRYWINRETPHYKRLQADAKAALKALQAELPNIVKNSKLPDAICINEGTEAIITYNELKNLKEEE